MKMKKALAACALLFLIASPLAAADAMPRSEWHNLVSACAQNPQTLRETMAKVSPGDQVALLAEVNEAIAKMPGSDEVKGALFYAANSAAVKSAAKGNLANVLAEVFATVPPEYLTVINERFAKEVFNRSANTSRTFTDEQYTALAKNAMATINARCEKAENAGVRQTFAVLMFVRASNGTPADLAETLVATMPDARNREQAANEWVKPALADGPEKSYDAMLGVAQAGEEPDHAVVTTLTSGSDAMVALLGDLAAEHSDVKKDSVGRMGAGRSNPSSGLGAASGIGLNRVPRAYVSSPVAVGGDSSGTYESQGDPNRFYTEDRGYPSQF